MLYQSITALALLGAVNAADYIDPARITRQLEQAQNRHQSSLDNYHSNQLNHPELFDDHQRYISRAGEIEHAARLRSKRQLIELEKRQNDGNGTGTGGGIQGAVELFDFFSAPIDVMIYAPSVNIGTPPQSFPLLVDTGSADLWVYTQATGSDQPEWDASASSSAVVSQQAWSIQYGKGSQTGFLNQDIVELGGYSADTVFAAANTLNEAFQPYPISGLTGMGFGVISSSGYAPWFERLLNASVLPNPYFSLYLVRAADVTNEAQGSIGGAQLCVGCYDPTKFTGEISWNPVVSEAFWTIAMDGIEVNGAVVSGTQMNAALDSGTSLIQIPVAAAEAFYAELGGIPSTQGDGTYLIPCNQNITSIGFVFDGITYEIPPNDLLRAISRDGTTCLLTIAGVDNRDARGNTVAIIGDVFLKNAYSIYSYSYNGSPAIGLARSIIAGSWNSTSPGGTGGGASASGQFSNPGATGSISVTGVIPPQETGVTAVDTSTRGGGLNGATTGSATDRSATRSASGAAQTGATATPSPTSGARQLIESSGGLLGMVAGLVIVMVFA